MDNPALGQCLPARAQLALPFLLTAYGQGPLLGSEPAHRRF